MPADATAISSTVITCRRCFRRLFHDEQRRGTCGMCRHMAETRMYRLLTLGQITHPTTFERSLQRQAMGLQVLRLLRQQAA